MKIGCFWAMIVVLVISTATSGWANLADFDDLTLPQESYWNGADYSGGFSSGQASFNNSFTDWGGGFTSWEGFAYSNLSQEDPPLIGLAGQYTAITGAAQTAANYAIGYVGYSGLPTMTFDQPMVLDGAYFTNTNYNYYSMRDGDGFAKKFGGETGDEPDFFKLVVKGFDEQDVSAGSLDFYLADYRFQDNAQDYIVDDWRWADLSGLGAVKKVTFNLSSSDNGAWGMNTPAYFAMDTVIPAPLNVEIDIRPWSDRNMVNLRSRGFLPVAVLGSEDFDVCDIDLLSLEMADAEPRTRGKWWGREKIGWFRDVNGDSLTDLMLRFRISDLDIERDTTELVLEGMLTDGRKFRGTDSIVVVPRGDVNGDGMVGVDDLVGVLSSWGQSETLCEKGDLDGDGLVGASDYVEVLNDWGTSFTSSQATAIPEPSTCLVLLAGLGATLLRRR